MIRRKRAYEPKTKDDGYRVLVERLWPRGVKKEEAGLDAWAKDVSPSPELRTWYAHEAAKWTEFRERYRRELREGAAKEAFAELLDHAAHGDVTLVYAARDEDHNSARVLQEELEKRLARRRAPPVSPKKKRAKRVTRSS